MLTTLDWAAGGQALASVGFQELRHERRLFADLALHTLDVTHTCEVNMFGFRKRQPAIAPLPTSFGSNAEYWLALRTREPDFHAQRVRSALEEVADVERSDWWGNFPGVGNRMWSNLFEAVSFAAVGEWDNAAILINNRCLTYGRLVEQAAFRDALVTTSPSWVSLSLGNASSAIALARSWAGIDGYAEALAQAVAHWQDHLAGVKARQSQDWESTEEYAAVNAMLAAMIADDLEAAADIRTLLHTISFETDHAPRMILLSQDTRDEAAQEAFARHFNAVRSRTSASTRWKRPNGFDGPQYLVLCSVLFERMHANWDGPIDWRYVVGAMIR